MIFYLKYNKIDNYIVIVGFEAEPSYDVKYSYEGDFTKLIKTCSGIKRDFRKGIRMNETVEIFYSYSVEWIESEKEEWSLRWDLYMKCNPENHYIVKNILYDIIIKIIISTIIINDLMEYLGDNDPSYNRWRYLRGDVCRTPPNPMLFSIMIGIGYQLFWMSLFCMTFEYFDIFSSSKRGSLLSGSLFLFLFFSPISGYSSARLYKLFKGKNYKKMIICNLIFFPCLLLTYIVIDNIIFYLEDSSGFISLSSLIKLLFLWFGISSPLVFIGSYYGLKRDIIKVSCETNEEERENKPITWITTFFLFL